MTSLPDMLVTIAPLVLGGALNVAFVKAPVLERTKRPIDGGRLWRDGAALFGPNKTWKGVIGMITLTALAYGAYAVWLRMMPRMGSGVLLPYGTGRPAALALLDGALLGLAYVVAELPNSFAKRRIGIAAGKNSHGIVGAMFTVIDQADSVLGCAVVLLILTPLSYVEALVLIALGTGIHLLVNVLLYLVGLKQQAR